MNLSDDELQRYARHIVLPQVGGVGQRRLKAARIVVIGAGGIGSAVIPALAGAGIGEITIVDSDVVELANLHRQPLYGEEDLGQPKAELAAAFVTRVNSSIEARAIHERIGRQNAAALIAGQGMVIDGSDNFATRLAVSDACVASDIPLLSAAAVQFQGQVGLFRSKPCYRCFVGDAFDADDCDTCAELGVLGALTGTVGSFAALLAVNFILGIGEDQFGMLHLFDGEQLSWRSLKIPSDEGCKACASGRSQVDR